MFNDYTHNLKLVMLGAVNFWSETSEQPEVVQSDKVFFWMIKLKTYFDKRQTKLNSEERYKESI